MKRTRQSQSDRGEGVMGRRTSRRELKKIKYFEEKSIEETLETDESNEEEDQKQNEQPGPSIQRGAQHNRLLLVSCGDKKGILNVEKLSRAEECIESEGRWFSPTAFETFSGRSSSRKWKQSIFCEGKPLQTLFECGVLSTNGFYRRRTNIPKPKKITLDPESESSSKASEVQFAEEIEGDDGWKPASEELVVEAKEEQKGKEERENGGETADSIDEQEMETPVTISPLKEYTLQSAVVVLKKIQELEGSESQCQTISSEDSDDDCEFKPLDQYMQSGREKQHSGSATDDSCIAAAMQDDSRQISRDKSIIGAECKRHSNNRRQHGQTEILNEKGNSVRPLSAPTPSSDSPENIGPINSLTANPSASSVSGFSNTTTDTREEKEGGVLEIEQYVKRKDLPDMSNSEASGRPPANVNISDATPNTITPEQVAEDESVEPMKQSAARLSHTGATANGHVAAQVINQEARAPKTTKASDTYSSGMEEGVSSQRSKSVNLDAMDLDQLIQEKMKMQIKVLRLQEEYYSLKVQGIKK
ncbi:uncharacterized protein LOC115047102 [Echeneis naucrates]|uniref:Uncharacterized LOC115047102 n=1 Tax=Echeneis naucrates TaxID=173247 RepID=A0A665WSY2_ECHNA|nr:uncharacterized protein LOC115047102 [Echeneis naucrates]